MQRVRALDLCCGGGGISAGLVAAGFDVVGVDVEPQPWYPYEFVQADGLTFPLDGFDVVFVSPPCQRYSRATPAYARPGHPDLVDSFRDRLIRSGLPYVIENVAGAPLRGPVQLCGTAFGLGVWRHRLFESNLPLAGTGCAHGLVPNPVNVAGSVPVEGVDSARAAMGIDWLPWESLIEAVPPMYGWFLGRQVASALVGAVSLPSSPREVPSTSASSRLCPCGQPLLRKPTGRWPLYCSTRCRQASWRKARAGAAT